jgi:hypothetical protein
MSISASRGVLARLLSMAAIGSAALVLASTATAQAATAYGPPVPVPPGIPGGYKTVIISQPIGRGGGYIGPLVAGPAQFAGARRAATLTVKVAVPKGAFTTTMLVTLTKPNVSSISVPNWPRYRAYAGVGVFVGFSGAKFHGTFVHPLKLWLDSHAIVKSDILMMWRGKGWIRVRNSIHQGSAYATFSGDPAFALLHKIVRGRAHHARHLAAGHRSGHRARGVRAGNAVLTRASARLDASAAGSGTGTPLSGVMALAAGLVIAGAGSLTWAARRRALRRPGSAQR